MQKHNSTKCLFLFLLISGMFISGCDDKNKAATGAQPPSVIVHIVKTAPFAVTTELPGRTSAFRIAEVRPQVDGIILKRNFTEGSDV